MKCFRQLPITLVALTGLAGSGKDTVADVLVQHHGFIKLAFAEALRAEVSAAFSFDLAHLTQRETKEHPISALALDRCLDPGFLIRMQDALLTLGHINNREDIRELAPVFSAPRSPRQILQWWGTEYRRAQDPDYWITRTHQAIAILVECGRDRFVLSDCRFENEAALVRRLQGSIWQVVRPGIAPVLGAHVSETEGNQFLPQVLLDNTGDIRHLQLQALAACNRLQLVEATNV